MKKEEGHITKVTGEVLYMGTGIPLLSHVGNDASLPFCALVMAGKEVCGVMPDVMMSVSDACCDGGGGVMMRPQGGGGIDHPNKVQQKKAQTDRSFSDPGGYSYPFSIIGLEF